MVLRIVNDAREGEGESNTSPSHSVFLVGDNHSACEALRG